MDLVGRKYYIMLAREAERLPYKRIIFSFRRGGVPDGPFPRKSYFVTVRGVEDIAPYNV